MKADPTIVPDPKQITPAWMTSVLRNAGYDVEVCGVDSGPIGTGQMAHSERFFLSYADAAPGAPATVVGKFPSPDEESRRAGASGAYRAEVRFYTDLASQLSIRVPACFYGAVDSDSTSFSLILEDMAPAAQADQIAGASDGQIEKAIIALAGLHGPRWNDAALLDIDWMAMGLGDAAADIVQAVSPIFVDRFRDRLSVETVRVFEGFARGIGRWLESMPSQHTVVHGDFRLDNLLFATDQGGVPVAAVDWQTVSISSGGRDVGFLLGTSSDAEARRMHQDHMLEAYRVGLSVHGVERTASQILADFRQGSFQGPFITMLGSMAVGRTERGDAMFIAMAERSAALICDLEALDLVL